MMKMFAALVILTIINMGSCELITTLSSHKITEEGEGIPVADVIEPRWGREPTQTPDRFLNSPGKHRIIGGNKTDIEVYPFIASLRLNKSHICGSSYIHAGWILTAVHCLRQGAKQEIKTPIENLEVYMGSADLLTDEQFRQVVKAITHEKYDPTLYVNDIALLKIDKPFDLGPKIKIGPVQTTERNFEKAVCTVIGWGHTSNVEPKNLRKGSRYLLKLQLKVTSKNLCVKFFAIPDRIKDPGVLCAGRPAGKGSCQGDSGGPFICDNIQVGVVSAGRGCAKGGPTMFTRVYNYIHWIKSHIKSFPIPANSGNSFKCSVSVYIIILGVFIFQNIL